VRETLQDMDEEIAELGHGSVILCTDYTTCADINEYDGIDAHLAITHDYMYVLGDAYVNSCENRHSFNRQWLARFRGVSKHYLQVISIFSGFGKMKCETGSTQSQVTIHRHER